MLKQIEGSLGVAEAIALCRPEVVCAYPISPQTHIVENLGAMVKKGTLTDCEFINVESEFAAMSVAIGGSVAGGRAYTATASQGLLYMAEAVYNASGLGLPIVMTVASRAIGAPINIWNDHSDSLSQRDCGWIQLFAEDNQEAVDLHIQAFKIAEEVSLPVMVCMDGFVLTHAFERMDIPTQEQVDAFLPPYDPRQSLDPENPVSIGAMVGPEAFTEVRYLAHAHHLQSLQVIDRVSKEFEEIIGRKSGGLIDLYRAEDAEVMVIALGSTIGTIKDVIDEMREDSKKVGLLGIKAYRPFPQQEVFAALEKVKTAVVIDRALQVGIGGVVTDDIIRSTRGLYKLNICGVIAGLGGRPIYKRSLHKVFDAALRNELPELSFLDLEEKVVNDQLRHEQEERHIGPTAEAIVRAVADHHKGEV
nr:pyruvate ferredoxin oxidoreductase [uncultured Parasutterella sp.]